MTHLAHTTAIREGNASHLVKRACDIISRENSKTFESLISSCLRVVDASIWEDVPAHLRCVLEASYTCTSCSRRMLCTDSHYLSEPLFEKVTLFSPPIPLVNCKKDSNLIRYQSCNQTHYIIGEEDWRFCAECLQRHKGEDGCGCVLCKEEQRVLNEDLDLRWARRLKKCT